MYNIPSSNTTREGTNKKVVVITGASSGVGLAAALAFAQSGATLILAARREAALEAVAEECRQLGATALVVPTDVTNAGAVQELATAAVKFGGRIDVWVNNAGVLAAGDFLETPVAVHDQVIKTNLMGYVHGAYAVLPYFVQQQYGVLINNISVGGWIPTPYGVGYAASKFGLRGFSEALRGELSKWPRIHVCDLFPAFLDTPGIQHAGNYSGRALKPAPPIYDPQKVARAMVSLAQRPRRAVTVGSAATLLRIAHFISPVLTRTITARAMEAYFKQAAPIAETSGNLFGPVEYGASIHGGWSTPVSARTKNTAALLVGGLAVGLLFLRMIKSNK